MTISARRSDRIRRAGPLFSLGKSSLLGGGLRSCSLRDCLYPGGFEGSTRQHLVDGAVGVKPGIGKLITGQPLALIGLARHVPKECRITEGNTAGSPTVEKDVRPDAATAA